MVDSEGCEFPPPEGHPRHAALWEIWRDTAASNVAAGMDGVPQGRDLTAVAVVAKAHGEPLDPEFFQWFGVVQGAWLHQIRRAAAAKNGKR